MSGIDVLVDYPCAGKESQHPRPMKRPRGWWSGPFLLAGQCSETRWVRWVANAKDKMWKGMVGWLERLRAQLGIGKQETQIGPERMESQWCPRRGGDNWRREPQWLPPKSRGLREPQWWLGRESPSWCHIARQLHKVQGTDGHEFINCEQRAPVKIRWAKSLSDCLEWLVA